MSTLPPLPEPFVAEGGDKHVYWPDQYVAEQMRDYALAATAPLEARIAELEKALKWYRDEAAALAKHMQSGAHTQAVLASVTVLSLDAGRRADTAMKDHP